MDAYGTFCSVYTLKLHTDKTAATAAQECIHTCNIITREFVCAGGTRTTRDLRALGVVTECILMLIAGMFIYVLYDSGIIDMHAGPDVKLYLSVGQ